ncbi:ABC transporter permease [Oceanirhabdus seepicola]|uniref:ABC transporter permease n=1 Tax=Oceanirhabdus seepicola TaxID=2828781 RepID=A0A9J6NZI0_9CLOT|nr:ABC transporter permease [Oceanirhabdus seepicola]MCM1989366.1 ABC transporter permease [Oceanirhabdus seepicola]
MGKQLLAIIKNDLKIIFKSKMIFVMIGSLIVYSFYIGFIYSKVDIEPYSIYVYDENSVDVFTQNNIFSVASEDELYKKLDSDKEGIGILDIGSESKIILKDSGDAKVNNMKKLYANNLLEGNNTDVNVEVLKQENLEIKRRLEMTSVVVFFEITAISFLSIAAIFFKEKEMGVLNVYSIMPIHKILLILSKILVFTSIEIIFATILSIINIDYGVFSKVFGDVIIQILLLAPIMVTLGYIFSLIYKNFKQFIFAYIIIVILFTSPVFLFVSSPINWSGIKFFPTYYLFNNLYNAFFNNLIFNPYYYICWGIILGMLFVINVKLINREMIREGV